MMWMILLGVVVVLLFWVFVGVMLLIIEEEVKLLLLKGVVVVDWCGILCGFKVEFILLGESVSLLFLLVLKFELFGGVKIDFELVKMIFFCLLNVDFIVCVKLFVKFEGINM